MLLSRHRASKSAKKEKKEAKAKEKFDLQDFVSKRDFAGAITLLEVKKRTNPDDPSILPWLAYSYFHSGEYQKSLDIYQKLAKEKNSNPAWKTAVVVCLFYLSRYDDVVKEAPRANFDPQLVNRVLFHTAHRENDEEVLMKHHSRLKDVCEDQLALAAIHYLRSHFQEASETYKRLLVDNKEYTALHLYIAMCTYKADQFEAALEVLQTYLEDYPASPAALNLKAACQFRLYNGKVAEQELSLLADAAGGMEELCKKNAIFRHNLVVFREGEVDGQTEGTAFNAMQTLQPLVDVIPEARLNLVVYYMHRHKVQEAYDLIKDLEPALAHEYILKAVVFTVYGQEKESREHLRTAQSYFQMVGGSAGEVNTIPGRQCMASCFFLLKQFEDVLVYLRSIKNYFYNEDNFNYNFGIAQAAVGNYQEAEDSLLHVRSEDITNEYYFLSWLAQCYIMNNRPQLAWELFVKVEAASMANEAFGLLQLISNSCYKAGHFIIAARAFDQLERLDPNPEYWEGKRGALMGAFRDVIAKEQPPESMREIMALLRHTSNPQVEYIVGVLEKWSSENGVQI